MSVRLPTSPRLIGRLSTPALIVSLFVLALSACVLGLVVWKGYDARRTALAQSKIELRNLSHSIAAHAAHTIQSAEVAMDDVVAFLRWRPAPTSKFSDRLREIADSLPQISEMAVFDAEGVVQYASVQPVPRLNNADRGYFLYHRDHADRKLQITGPVESRTSGRPVIVLSRRLETPEGGFAGIVVATIECDYFTAFYQTFDLGDGGGVSLIDATGKVMIRWPQPQHGRDLSQTHLIRKLSAKSPSGHGLAVSPFDQLVKYYAYQRVSLYPLLVTVARTEDSVLAGWREAARSDAVVAITMLACIGLLAAGLAAQLRSRQQVEGLLREREARYRLIDANIGDIVILLDRDRNLYFVSMSVKAVLGFRPDDVLGRRYLDLLHPEDLDLVRLAVSMLRASSAGHRVEFRAVRADGSVVWLEAHFRPTDHNDPRSGEIVGALRDITRRKAIENEVEALNSRLAELARTDGLTGLPNRRSLDGFIDRSFAAEHDLSVLMIDVDDFKGFNDRLGHPAGDDALRRIGALLADTVADTGAFAARYGGEEFTIVLPGASGEAALECAAAFHSALRQLDIVNPAAARGRLTVSIGIASKDRTTPDAATLLREADVALYQAKQRGRDCSVAAAPASVKADAAPLAPDQEPMPLDPTHESSAHRHAGTA
jgi:diguanylate cyclase (GGDEF)-like protein/PAS domain S-box-containing protein